MAPTHKKVIVRRFFGDVLPGYLPASSFVRQGEIELLDLDGHMVPVPLIDVKQVSYVRDFNLADTVNPERLTRRSYLARPRSEGLWIRLTFKSNTRTAQENRSPDSLEGLAASGLPLFDDLLTDSGIHLTPPDSRSNTLRIFVPRSSISDLQILAVITTPSRPKGARPASNAVQEDLFSASLPPKVRVN